MGVGVGVGVGCLRIFPQLAFEICPLNLVDKIIHCEDVKQIH